MVFTNVAMRVARLIWGKLVDLEQSKDFLVNSYRNDCDISMSVMVYLVCKTLMAIYSTF
jgi:hypothetical protein